MSLNLNITYVNINDYKWQALIIYICNNKYLKNEGTIIRISKS